MKQLPSVWTWAVVSWAKRRLSHLGWLIFYLFLSLFYKNKATITIEKLKKYNNCFTNMFRFFLYPFNYHRTLFWLGLHNSYEEIKCQSFYWWSQRKHQACCLLNMERDSMLLPKCLALYNWVFTFRCTTSCGWLTQFRGVWSRIINFKLLWRMLFISSSCRGP